MTRLSICANPSASTCEGEDFRIQAAADPKIEFGFSMAMGYLNNDRFKDLVVGAPGEGKVYIFFGSVVKSNFPAPDPNNPAWNVAASNADVILKDSGSTKFGFSVAVGLSDPDDMAPLQNPLIIGAPRADAPGTNDNRGAAYVVPEGLWTNSNFVNAANNEVLITNTTIAPGVVTINGVTTGAEAGYSVAIGPVRMGGSDDFVVGARKAGGSAKGVVYVFTETSSTPLSTVPNGGINPTIVSITGELANGGLGESVLVDDFMHDGAPYEVAMSGVGTIPNDTTNPPGRVYVVPVGSANIDLALSLPSMTLAVQGDTKNDFFGFSLASGDFDGLGISLAVGAIYADRPKDVYSAQLNSGAVYVFRTPWTNSLPIVRANNVEASHIIWGRRLWDELGFGLAAGDVNGDAIDDLVAAARRHDRTLTDADQVDAGAVYVLYGDPNFQTSWSNCDLAGTCTCTNMMGACTALECASDCAGPDPNNVDAMVFGGGRSDKKSDQMGFSLAVGDFNHDSKFSDIAVSSLTHSRVYLVSMNNEDANVPNQPKGQEHDAVGDIRDRDDDGDGYLDTEEDSNRNGVVEDTMEPDPLIPNVDVAVSFDPNTPSAVFDCDNAFPVRILVTNVSRKLAIPAGTLNARLNLSSKLQCASPTSTCDQYTPLTNVSLDPNESHSFTFYVRTMDEPGDPNGHSIQVEVAPVDDLLNTSPKFKELRDSLPMVPVEPNTASKSISLTCPDLEIVKMADDNTPAIGGTVIFELILSNEGTAGATGVQVSDQLPDGYTYQSHVAPTGTTYDVNTGVWDVGEIIPNAMKTLKIITKVKPAGLYKNTAEVTNSTQKELMLGNNESEADVKPGPVVNLGLTKRVNNPTPLQGANVIFTLTLSNASGFNDATGVTVSDQLPNGYTYQSSVATTGTTYDANTGVWNVGSVQAGALPKILDITARVNTGGLTGAYNNCAQVMTATPFKDVNSTPGNFSTTEDDDDCAKTTPKPKLKLVKTVVNNNGGTKMVSDFPLFISGIPVTSGVVNTLDPNVASFTATETSPRGYTPSVWGADCAPGGTITLLPGADKTCTITNDDVAPQLKLVKTVVNNNGGKKVVSDFPLFINGNPVTSGVSKSLLVNTMYKATETNQPGYTPSVWGGDCAPDGTITLALGDDKTCTITNDDVAPKLTLVKIVVNDNGGKKVVSDFPLFINGIPATSGVSKTLLAHTMYTATETSLPGYAPSVWVGDCAPGGTITLMPGDNKTCTIINDDVAPKLTLVKMVVNDNGGTKVVSDFPLFISGVPATSGVSKTLSANTEYTATETNQPGYTPSVWGGDCAPDGTITLMPGDNKTCTITNDD